MTNMTEATNNPPASNQSFFERLNNWIKNSITIKLLSIGFLILILLIPAAMITDLISERQYTREGAIEEVSSKWGNVQTITGPVLSIPYIKYFKNEKDKLVETVGYAHFLPEHLNITGNIVPEIRYRGIYKVILYSADLSAQGNFSLPDFKKFSIAESDIMWQDAFISLGIPDMRGIKENITIKWNDSNYYFNPGIESKDIISSGVSTRIQLLSESLSKQFDFSFTLRLNGSSQLNFIPLGKETGVEINSGWGNPSFNGAFLPDNRNITPDGFTAHWKVLHLNRNYPQQWLGSSYHVEESAFGVELLIPVDEYQKTMRSAKYAIMLIALTFLVFFFVEVLNKQHIHPFQYILVGLALCLFYTLLLSFSEHMNFNLAYVLAALAIIIMIIAYSKTIFKNNRLTGVMGLILVMLFGFIYIVLQLQDYALLIGSIGLFMILATVMYLSRKINWYGKEDKSE